MDTVVILNNLQYTHTKYTKYWELICESVEPYSKVLKSDEIDDFVKQPFETINNLAVIVFDDYGASKARNWIPIINKISTWTDRDKTKKCSIIIADNHTLNKSIQRDKRFIIKKEW